MILENIQNLLNLGYEFFGISQSVVQNLFEIEGPPNLDISTFEIWTNYRNMFVAHNKLMKSYRNLTIFENTVTTKIIPINDEVEIRISKEPKSYKFIRSKKLVLCCGTIENNRIVINLENQNPGILKSKIKPGSYYLTHIMNHINFIKLENSIYQKKTVGGIQTRRRIRLSDDCQDKLSILNSAAFFAHNASGNFSQVFQDPFATIHKIFNNYGTNLPKYLWNYRHSLLNLKNVSTEMPVGEVLHLQSEMAPNTDSGIELLDKADGWGNYLVEPKLSFSEVDFKTVRLTLLTIIEELDIECNKDDINSELDSQLRMLADKPESQHQLGGLRIGNSKEFSLTDSYGALFGVPQIYCLGGSMFPTAGQANSTLPMVVLALRSAAKIIQEF